MNSEAIARAAQLFADARRHGTKLPPLPADLQPATFDEGHAIQDATVALWQEPVAGWKVAIDKAGAMTRAPIFAKLTFESPARVAAHVAPLLRIESEIAFRFLRDLPPRGHDYTRAELTDAVAAFAAIEILNSRYAEVAPRTQLEKLADCFNNGGIVTTPARKDWTAIDFMALEVILTVDGKEVARRTGTHPTGDPLGPALVLVNSLRKAGGVKAGQFMTTGTWTGITEVSATSTIVAQFHGFPPAQLQFTS